MSGRRKIVLLTMKPSNLEIATICLSSPLKLCISDKSTGQRQLLANLLEPRAAYIASRVNDKMTASRSADSDIEKRGFFCMTREFVIHRTKSICTPTTIVETSGKFELVYKPSSTRAE